MVCVVHLLIILCLCVLATSKVTVQGLFAKTNIKGFCDSLFFNALVFLFLVLIFFKDILTLNFSVFLFSLVFWCIDSCVSDVLHKRYVLWQCVTDRFDSKPEYDNTYIGIGFLLWRKAFRFKIFRNTIDRVCAVFKY